jgi:predicted transcriptional regulator
MAKSKLSITVEKELLTQVQEVAAIQSRPISHVIEAALQQFLTARLAAEMEQGYLAMAELDRELAESDMAAGYEVLPDA